MRTFLAAALATVALGSGVAAIAPSMQAQAQAASQSNPAPAPEARHKMRLPSERIEARLAYIKTALKITDAQQAQWNALADVLRKHAKARDEEIKQMMANAPKPGEKGAREHHTAIDRLEQMQKRMAQAASNMSEVLAAAKPLYASLSDEQKATADELLSHRGGFGGRGGMHGMRGMGGEDHR